MGDGDGDRGRDRQTDSDSLLTDVLDTSEVGTFILDSDFYVVWVNEAVEDYFGLDRDDVLGADKRELVTEQIKDRFDDPERFAEQVLATYDDNTYVENFECHVRDTEATDERWLEHWSQPIESGPYAGGRIEHYTDITDQKYREQELERRRRELEHQTERLENFASVLSHDLRTPLYTARTYAGVLRQNGDAEEAVVSEIERALDRADDIVDDVLALAREGTSVTNAVPVELRTVAESAWANVATPDATLRVRDECTVTADVSQTTRLFENLFQNAVEHGSTGNRPEADDAVEHSSTSPRSQAHEDVVERNSSARETQSHDAVEHGSTSPRSETREDGNTEEDGDGGVTVDVGRIDGEGFYVADDGPGIPAEERDRVFDWAYSTRTDGTGFGLAIVRQIADVHGWDVAVTESDRGGARFEFRNVDVTSESASA